MVLTFLVSMMTILLSLFLAWLLGFRRVGGRARKFLGIALSALSLPPLLLALYIAAFTVSAFFLSEKSESLHEGIHYSQERLVLNQETFVSHSVKIDTDLIHAFISSPVADALEPKNSAMITTRALELNDADLAINASFFTPFRDKHLFDFHPQEGDLVIPIGPTFSDNVLYGELNVDWPVYSINTDGSFTIQSSYDALLESFSSKAVSPKYILSGKSILVANGKVNAKLPERQNPRTAIGMSEDGRFLWLFVVDGKQFNYSNGVSLATLAEHMVSKGVYQAIEMDGGGSSTMAWRNSKTNKAQLLNRPIHTKIPNRQRPVANHFFVRLKN